MKGKDVQWKSPDNSIKTLKCWLYRNYEANILMFMLKIIITRREKTPKPQWGRFGTVRCFLKVRGCVTACKGHCPLLGACTLAWEGEEMKTRMPGLRVSIAPFISSSQERLNTGPDPESTEVCIHPAGRELPIPTKKNVTQAGS